MINKITVARWWFKVRWGGTLGEEHRCIYIPPVILRKINIAAGSSILFKAGVYKTTVKVLPLSSHSPGDFVVFFSPDLLSSMGVAEGQIVTLRYDKSINTLSLGPFIGLFTVRNILPESEYGSQEPVLAALTNSSADIEGIIYVFCPEDINWDELSVTAHVPFRSAESDTLSWNSVTMPLPDVIYDRIPSRSIEARPEVQEAKSKLKNLGLTYFNPMFLDKWETHTALCNIPDVAGYLPPTRLVEIPEHLTEFLSRYKSVFLKPSSGSLGRRIIKISQDFNGYSYVYRSRDKQTVRGTVANAGALITQLKPVMGKRSYIIQKDVNLALYENCTFDIRVLAQKDRFGNWRRTKIYTRAAAPDSFLSNLSDGARPQPINTVLQKVFNTTFADKNGLGEDIRTAVNKIPPALESATGMKWAELGIDLGLDTQGRIWLIEVNSKPFRTLISNSGLSKTVRRSLLRPLEYAKFLAGFYKHSPITDYSAFS